MNATGAYRKYVFTPTSPTRMDGLFGFKISKQPNTKVTPKTFLIRLTPFGDGNFFRLSKINPKYTAKRITSLKRYTCACAQGNAHLRNAPSNTSSTKTAKSARCQYLTASNAQGATNAASNHNAGLFIRSKYLSYV